MRKKQESFEQKNKVIIDQSEIVIREVYERAVGEIMDCFGIEPSSVERLSGIQTFMEIYSRMKEEA